MLRAGGVGPRRWLAGALARRLVGLWLVLGVFLLVGVTGRFLLVSDVHERTPPRRAGAGAVARARHGSSRDRKTRAYSR